MDVLHRSERLKKELGLFGVYAIATGATLSTGFFLLPGLAAASAGPAVPLAYAIAAIPMIPAMFSMVELATAMPRAGGAYYFLDRSMGPLVGTIGGLGTWLALALKTAFALVGMGAYLQLVLPDMPVTPLAVGSALLFGVVNIMGAKGASSFQKILVTGLLVILIWFMGGIFHVDPARFQGFFSSGAQNLFATAGLVYVSYIGITKVASVSEEIKNPERNLPLGIFLSLATALVIYVVGTSVMVGVLPMEQLAGNLTPVASTAERLVGHWGVILVLVAALLAFSSVSNAAILSASRYPLAMSRDHLVPAFFRKLSARQTPVAGVCATVGLVLLILLLFDPTRIAKLASSFQLLLFALVCLAVIVMRESRIDSYDPGFRSPFYPWMQIFGILAPIALISQMGWLPILFACGLIGVGVLWYVRYARARVKRHGAIYHIFERLGQQRYAPLDTELRGILKEKGLRDQDPFDEVVAQAYVIDLKGEEDFETVAEKASELLARHAPATAGHILDGLMRGTRMGATPVSHGAALPHVRLHGVDHPVLVLVRARGSANVPLMDEFGEELLREEPVQALFFLLSPEDNPGLHLRILAQIAGRVDDEAFMSGWLAADNEQQLKEILLRDERYLSLHLDASSRTGVLISRALHEIEIPEGCLVAIIHREDVTFVPRGNTTLNQGDRLTIIGDPKGIKELQEKYG